MLLVFMRCRFELTNQIPVLNSLHGYITGVPRVQMVIALKLRAYAETRGARGFG